MSWKRLLPVSLCALCCLAGVLALHLLEPAAYLRTRNQLRDAFTRAGRKTPANPGLIFLAIDSESVGLEKMDAEQLYGLTDPNLPETKALRLMSHRWPWSREIYAMVLDRLIAAGARVVLFDLTFPTPSDGDEPFRLALERYADRVVIGSNFVDPVQDSPGTKGPTQTRPTETLIPEQAAQDERVAYTNFWPDDDDVVRHAYFRVLFDDATYLSLAARGLAKAGFADRIPGNDADQIFRYTATARAGFPPHSIFQIFVPEYWQRNYQGGKFFRDKIVIIGAEGNWQHDEHPTPFGSMPGPEIHLNAINAALHGEFIREMPRGAVVLITLLAALLAIALSLMVRSPWLRLLLMLAIDALDIWLTLQAFNHLSLYVPCLPALLQFNLTLLLGLVCDFAFERVEKTRIRRTLEKYVSTNVVRELLDTPKAFQQSLGGVMKPAAILFSDIRGYSSVSARTDPQALVAQLNEYLSAMVECVFRYGGTLDKFIGDAVMAVWGNVHSEGAATDAANAVRAALAMRAELLRLNRDWEKRGLAQLRIGIAINQGEVVVGNIGSPQRMEFTVIGDAVNISWKLQELTKQVGADLIVSQSVAAHVVEHFELAPLGGFHIPGFSEQFEIFAVSQPIPLPENPELESVTSA